MPRRLASILSVLLMSSALAGCASDSGWQASWHVTKINRWTSVKSGNRVVKAEQLDSITDSAAIARIVEFLDRHRRGWEPLIASPPLGYVRATFYERGKEIYSLDVYADDGYVIARPFDAGLKRKNLSKADMMTLLKLLVVS
ncbi:MAG: hypothetical protein HYZ91_05830 [Candidatus Omnitrophica bacterium]|nr:hypothetical protein [Candidatus Omnitrophota bacterium]